MTDETDQALPESGSIPAPETPEQEPVDTGTTPDVAEDADTEGEQPDKPKGGFQRRIAELVDQRNEERRQREAYQRRLDYVLERMLEREQPAPAAPEPPAAPPTLEQHGFDEAKYQAAVLDYAKSQAALTARAELQQWQAQQQRAAKEQTFKTREAEFAATAQDYADTVYDPTLPITAAMAEVIQESDVGPQLAYHLAKNRDIAATLAKLPERAMARELGRLEAQLSKPVAAPPPPPPVSKAPPPPPKIEAVEPQVNKDPEQMDVDEWVKWRTKQLSRRPGR